MKKSILEFLGEDKVIVESVHKSYLENFQLWSPNRLEQRILHWQNIYKDFLNALGDFLAKSLLIVLILFFIKFLIWKGFNFIFSLSN